MREAPKGSDFGTTQAEAAPQPHMSEPFIDWIPDHPRRLTRMGREGKCLSLGLGLRLGVLRLESSLSKGNLPMLLPTQA